MNTVGHHQTRLECNVVQQERQQANAILISQGGVKRVELFGVDWQAAQAVVATQFQYDDFRLVLVQQAGKARGAALGRIARDAGVENAVNVTIFNETLLQQARPGLADFHAVGCAKAVAQDNDGGTCEQWTREPTEH